MRFSRVFGDGVIENLAPRQEALPSFGAFVWCPMTPVCPTSFSYREELYRLAFERAQALVLPPRHERLLAPSRN